MSQVHEVQMFQRASTRKDLEIPQIKGCYLPCISVLLILGEGFGCVTSDGKVGESPGTPRVQLFGTYFC